MGGKTALERKRLISFAVKCDTDMNREAAC